MFDCQILQLQPRALVLQACCVEQGHFDPEQLLARLPIKKPNHVTKNVSRALANARADV